MYSTEEWVVGLRTEGVSQTWEWCFGPWRSCQQILECLPYPDVGVPPAWAGRERSRRGGLAGCRLLCAFEVVQLTAPPTACCSWLPTPPYCCPLDCTPNWGPPGHLPASVHPPFQRGTLNCPYPLENKLRSGSLCCLHPLAARWLWSVATRGPSGLVSGLCPA